MGFFKKCKKIEKASVLLCFFQLSVPENRGGLKIEIVRANEPSVDKNEDPPKRSILLAPTEVLLFVDALPYCLLNRHGGKHAFWTALGSISNLKGRLETALENRDRAFLETCVTQLKAGQINPLLSTISGEWLEGQMPLDLATLGSETFEVFDALISREKFCDLLLSQVFLLKYKLVAEGKANQHVVKHREPPKILYNHDDHRWQVGYDEGDFAKIDPPVDLFDLVLPRLSPEKCKNTTHWNNESPAKKTKITDAELTAILADAVAMYQDMHETGEKVAEQTANQATTTFYPRLPDSRETTSTPQEPEDPTLRDVHIHLHLTGESHKKKLVTYEICSKKMMKVTVEEI